ncbi:MAG: hypothetical protein HY423_16730 [Candidatus Lambdaproteobacteria bacterium]|nr:hypothetical protein [Candidatus Lambdaproteobacteria bacterium]
MAQDIAAGDSVDGIRPLIVRQDQLEQECAELESRLEALRAQLREIAELALPSAMDGLGFGEVKLSDGRRIVIEEQLTTSEKWRDWAAARGWIDHHDARHLLRYAMRVTVPTGRERDAESIVATARRLGLEAELKESLAPASLKRYCHERLAQGTLSDTDLDILGVHRTRRTRILPAR